MIKLQDLLDGVSLCIDNAQKLISASEVLEEKKLPGVNLFIITALEEVGKGKQLINICLEKGLIDSYDWTLEDKAKFKNHTLKQSTPFIDYVDAGKRLIEKAETEKRTEWQFRVLNLEKTLKIYNSYIEDINSRKIWDARNFSIYVNYSENESRFVPPHDEEIIINKIEVLAVIRDLQGLRDLIKSNHENSANPDL